MQHVSQEDLEQIIKEAKKAGKDTAKLEEELKKVKEGKIALPKAEKKEKKTEKGVRVIESTGPVREEDFE